MKNLKFLRQKQNLKQKDLSKILNCSQTLISKWEKNEREPDIEVLKKLSKLFNCSIDYLLDNEDEKKSNSVELDLKEYFTEKQIELIAIVKQLNNDDIIRVIGYAEALKQKDLSQEDKIDKLLKEYKGV